MTNLPAPFKSRVLGIRVLSSGRPLKAVLLSTFQSARCDVLANHLQPSLMRGFVHAFLGIAASDCNDGGSLPNFYLLLLLLTITHLQI